MITRSPSRRRSRDTGPDMETVMLVLNRDGYRCIRDGVPIEGDRGIDWVLHHRRARAMGGSRRPDTNSPVNLLSLCAPCHGFVESYRAEAYVKGWLVHTHHDPARVPVLVDHGSRWVYLDVAGSCSDNPPVECEQ